LEKPSGQAEPPHSAEKPEPKQWMTEAPSNAKKQYSKRELADYNWQPLETRD